MLANHENGLVKIEICDRASAAWINSVGFPVAIRDLPAVLIEKELRKKTTKINDLSHSEAYGLLLYAFSKGIAILNRWAENRLTRREKLALLNQVKQEASEFGEVLDSSLPLLPLSGMFVVLPRLKVGAPFNLTCAECRQQALKRIFRLAESADDSSGLLTTQVKRFINLLPPIAERY